MICFAQRARTGGEERKEGHYIRKKERWDTPLKKQDGKKGERGKSPIDEIPLSGVFLRTKGPKQNILYGSIVIAYPAFS